MMGGGGGGLRLVGEIGKILGKERLCKLGFNLPKKSKVMA